MSNIANAYQEIFSRISSATPCAFICGIPKAVSNLARGVKNVVDRYLPTLTHKFLAVAAVSTVAVMLGASALAALGAVSTVAMFCASMALCSPALFFGSAMLGTVSLLPGALALGAAGNILLHTLCYGAIFSDTLVDTVKTGFDKLSNGVKGLAEKVTSLTQGVKDAFDHHFPTNSDKFVATMVGAGIVTATLATASIPASLLLANPVVMGSGVAVASAGLVTAGVPFLSKVCIDSNIMSTSVNAIKTGFSKLWDGINNLAKKVSSPSLEQGNDNQTLMDNNGGHDSLDNANQAHEHQHAGQTSMDNSSGNDSSADNGYFSALLNTAKNKASSCLAFFNSSHNDNRNANNSDNNNANNSDNNIELQEQAQENFMPN